MVIVDRNGDLLKIENRELSVYYPRKESTIYILTDSSSLHQSIQLPDNTEIVEVEFDKQNNLVLEGLGEKLMNKGIYHLMTEAGAELNSFLIENKWADELCCFITPLLLMDNNALPIFKSLNSVSLDHSSILCLEEQLTFDDDIYLRYSFC